jgi:hypothetical protein
MKGEIVFDEGLGALLRDFIVKKMVRERNYSWKK